MPVLRNAKHEHFAQLIAGGLSAPKAYASAGYSEQGAAQSANRLLRDAEVSRRVDELRSAASERAIEKAAIDRAWIIEKLVENAKAAAAAEDFGPSNRALELLGKEVGMFIDRKEIRTGSLDEMKPDELRDLREAIAAERAARAGPGSGSGADAKPASGLPSVH